MKYFSILLLAITITTYAEDREHNYFKPIKASNQKQYNYILDNLIISAAKAIEVKDNSKVSSLILEDYDSVLRYKAEACEAYEINKTLEDFFKANKEFQNSSDKVRVYAFVSRAKLTEIEISGCDAIHKTYFNNLIEKRVTHK